MSRLDPRCGMATKKDGDASTKRRGSYAQTDVMRFKKAFDTQQMDKEGKVSVKELRDLAAKLGYRMSDQQVKDILENNDLDESSKVSFEQFVELIPGNQKQIPDDEHRKAELREKFQRYDLDGNGIISLNEAQWALQMELQVTPTTALRLLNQFVKLNYEQFVDFYQQLQEKKLEIYDKFGKYDVNMDGMISAAEAHRVLHDELGYSPERSDAMIERFDLNKDGQVSYLEFAEFYIAVEEKKVKIRQAFQRFDPEGRGFVSVEQAQEVMRDMLGFSDKKVEETVKALDKDNEGKIDYMSFTSFYSMVEEERQRLLSEFNRFDTNGDGRISFIEFKEMLTSQGYSEKDIETLMAGYDANKDGFLDFTEFKRYLNFS